MKIERITLRQIRMPLVHFFETSFGRTYERDIILVEVEGEGASGWGEVTAGENPFYNEEWTDSAWLIVRDYAAPRVLGRDLESAEDVYPLTAHIRGHNMARGGLETAVWDLEARQDGRSAVAEDRRRRAPRNSLRRLHRHSGFGGAVARKDRTRTGRRLPAHQDEDQAGLGCRCGAPRARAVPLHQADGRRQFRLHAGRRGPSEEARRFLPDDDRAAAGARRHHRSRRAAGAPQTPICLDECIRIAHHAEQAIRLRACGIINIKLGRVGGFGEARRVHDVAQAAGIPVWCGGMLEAGIGRAHNIALATLPNFVLPGDVSASKRYWKRDIIQPAVETTPHGTIAIRDAPGFGYALDPDFIRGITVREESLG